MNNIQAGILAINSALTKELSLDEIIESYYSLLERELGTLTREQSSNIYIILKSFAIKMAEAKLQHLEIISAINSFFDEHKFDGYIAGSYNGVRQGLLALDLFVDIKLISHANSSIQIILLPKLGVILTDNYTKFLIAQELHKLLPLTNTYKDSSKNLISQQINASTGQAITYHFYGSSTLKFVFNVSFLLDYEQEVEDLNFIEQINTSITSVYYKLYGKLGKDLVIKDFYSITRDVMGVKSVSITVEKLNEAGVVIATYDNVDVSLSNTEIFVIKEIKPIQLN